MSEQEAKRTKITQFWTAVATRKKNESSESWKLIHGTVLSKVHGPALESGTDYKICAFDLDNTVIATNSGRIISKDARDWRFNLPCVPKVINELFEENSASKSILVIFSNQLNLNSKVAERATFETKIDSVISKLGVASKCPIICLFSTVRDEFRKPCIGMWNILKNEFLLKNQCTINLEESFFVGDAAGRLASWKPGKSADWSSVDHKFAINVGLKFYTPEEFFLKDAPAKSYDLGRDPKAFNVSIGPVDSFLLSDIEENGLIVLIAVGSPASGKSTFYKKHLKSKNFVHVNRDTLKTIPKCISLIKDSLTNKKSIYIDNTHPTRESRQIFIEIAKEFQVPIKCLHFTSDEWLCKHLDIFRSITNKTEPLPAVAFNTFRSRYEPPQETEGFESIIQVPFSPNFNTDEEAKLFQSYLF